MYPKVTSFDIARTLFVRPSSNIIGEEARCALLYGGGGPSIDVMLLIYMKRDISAVWAYGSSLRSRSPSESSLSNLCMRHSNTAPGLSTSPLVVTFSARSDTSPVDFKNNEPALFTINPASIAQAIEANEFDQIGYRTFTQGNANVQTDVSHTRVLHERIITMM